MMSRTQRGKLSAKHAYSDVYGRDPADFWDLAEGAASRAHRGRPVIAYLRRWVGLRVCLITGTHEPHALQYPPRRVTECKRCGRIVEAPA